MAMVNRSACIYTAVVNCGRADMEACTKSSVRPQAQQLGGEAPDWRNSFSVQSSTSVWKLVDPFLETEGYLKLALMSVLER
jgi:hypothetical protein